MAGNKKPGRGKKTGRSNKRITIREDAKTSARKSMSGIIETYDSIKESKAKIIEPILAEMDITAEILDNNLEIPDRLEMKEEIEKQRQYLNDCSSAADMAMVEVDKIMHVAAEYADRAKTLASDRSVKTCDIKEELLSLELEHVGYFDKAVQLHYNVMYALQQVALGWSHLSNKVTQYQN